MLRFCPGSEAVSYTHLDVYKRQGQYIPQGLIYILSIAASISVSLGVFNLLPIPALDGSRILFALIELIKGSPVNKKAEGVVHFFGFVALMALAVFIAYKDIVTFF